MKKILLFCALAITTVSVFAQNIYKRYGLRSDTTFMGYRTDVLRDTVDESDPYYVFPDKPDSAMHGVYGVCEELFQFCDRNGDTVPVDTFAFMQNSAFQTHIAQKLHIDSTAQLYGIAITFAPIDAVVLPMPDDCYSESEFKYLDKSETQYRYELLRKVPSGTDSVMEIVDSLWLDDENLIKKCWFKYHIDETDTTEGVHCVWTPAAFDMYFWGTEEVTVPCYEIYFDDPFDTNHLVSGDFYVGRSNFNASEKKYDNTYYPYYKDDREKRLFFPKEFYPMFHCSTQDTVLENHFFTYDKNGKVQSRLEGLFNDYKDYLPWGFIFPITGLRCGQLHNVQLAEKGEAYVLWAWQGGEDDDDSQYQVRLIDNNKGDGGIIASDFLGDTSYMFTNLDEYGDYTFKIRKRCHYATTRYDTVVWSDWYSYPFKMKENPVDTTIVDTNIVDTTIVDTTIVDTTIVDTTGIRLALGDADFSVSPNPAHGSAVVRLQYAVTERGELTLYDMRGREVLRRPLERGMREVRLDLEDLPAGAYMLKVLTPRGLCSQRLLVQ